MERLLAPRRRGWLLATLATITVMYTWHSAKELAVLIEAEPELPEGAAGKGVLRLAEQNIARHLNIPKKLSSEAPGKRLPRGASPRHAPANAGGERRALAELWWPAPALLGPARASKAAHPHDCSASRLLGRAR